MSNIEHLKHLVTERLGGDQSRIGELFQDESVFLQLQAKAKDSDWYHFEPKTYDGQYLVRGYSGYQVYAQERGNRTDLHIFENLSDAAVHFFNAC